MDVHDIQSVWSNIDLQVTVDSTLKFLLHINNMCSEASKQANLLLRCFKSANLELRNSSDQGSICQTSVRVFLTCVESVYYERY